MKIVITQEDVKNNPYYILPDKCPCAIVLQKALKDQSITTCLSRVTSRTKGSMGVLNPPFGARDFRRLQLGEITEFVTEYTPNP